MDDMQPWLQDSHLLQSMPAIVQSVKRPLPLFRAVNLHTYHRQCRGLCLAVASSSPDRCVAITPPMFVSCGRRLRHIARGAPYQLY